MLSALCLLPSVPAKAADQGAAVRVPDAPPSLPPATRGASIRTASGRFVIYGADDVEKARLARWAEDTAGRVDRAIGIPMPMKNRLVRIVSAPGSAEESGTVIKETRLSQGRIVQSLVLVDAPRVKGEELLEAFCQLLLDGHVVYRQGPESRRTALLSAPEWLAVGLAQSLHPALRERNTKMVRAQLQDKRLPSFSDILDWAWVPGQMWSEKAACATAFGWLASLPDSRVGFEKIFARCAHGQPLSPAWMASEVVHCGSVGNLNEGWVQWVQRQDRIVQDLGALSYDLVEKFMTRLAVDRDDLGAAARSDMPESIPLRDLIALRDVPQVRDLARRKQHDLEVMSIGKAPEFGALASAYCRFFEELAAPRSGFRLRGDLRKAEQALAQLESRLRAAKEYLDSAERRMGEAEPEAAAPAAPAGAAARSELSRYVDDAESGLMWDGGGVTNAPGSR